MQCAKTTLLRADGASTRRSRIYPRGTEGGPPPLLNRRRQNRAIYARCHFRRDRPCGARIVIVMDRVPQQPVKDPPNLLRSGSFSLERLLSHIDPAPPEESEAFVHAIYEQRRIDVSSAGNRKTGR